MVIPVGVPSGGVYLLFLFQRVFLDQFFSFRRISGGRFKKDLRRSLTGNPRGLRGHAVSDVSRLVILGVPRSEGLVSAPAKRILFDKQEILHCMFRVVHCLILVFV